MKKIIVRNLFLIFLTISMTNCGFNTIQELDEKTNSAMAEMVNQYKRRSDLIPSLIEVVKGASNFEKEVITEVAKARSSVGSMKATPELVNDKEAFEKFMSAQNTLGSSLQRLMVVSENYPQLKSNEIFRDLQAQIEGTENRITVARGRYIKAVEKYNIYIRQFPGIIWASSFGYKVKVSLTVENEDSLKKFDSEISKPPAVDFGDKKK